MKSYAEKKVKDFKLLEDMIDFLNEIGTLKFKKRQGWIDINIVGDSCETIAAHSFRTGIIAYYLAKLEGFNENEAAQIGFLALIHDLEEVKTGDITPRQKKYVHVEKMRAVENMINDKWIVENLTSNKYKNIIQDADKLDMILQAKEYYDIGNKYAFDWIKTGKKELNTTSAKYIAELIENKDSKKWVFIE